MGTSNAPAGTWSWTMRQWRGTVLRRQIMASVTVVGPDRHPELMAALGDSPVTVVPRHLLLRGWGKARVVGEPGRFDAAVVEGTLGPEAWPAGEPTGLGSDAGALWAVLREMEGWDCVLVSETCAEELGALNQRDTGRAVRYYGEVCLAHSGPVRTFSHDLVRLLTPGDAAAVDRAAAPQLRGEGWSSVERFLLDGVAAGALVDGRLVALASTCARPERHAEIQIYTLEEWRGRGLATAAASLVARRIQESGQTPVWMAGEDNLASRHIAGKLGFTQVARRVYVILQQAAQRSPPLGP